MQTPFISGAGEAPRVTSSIVVALYEPDSGRVVHLHTVHMHQGSREVGEAEAIEQAQRHAQTLGHEPDRFGTAVSTDPAHGQLPHRIDPATGGFEPIDMPERAL
jgi:hypothetical protein